MAACQPEWQGIGRQRGGRRGTLRTPHLRRRLPRNS
jgi:hypothetical protein